MQNICHKCKQTFYSKQTLHRHLNRKRSCSVEESISICKNCNKTFTNKNSMYYHKNICKKSPNVDIDMNTIMDKLDEIQKKDKPMIININNPKVYNKINIINASFQNAPNFSLDNIDLHISDKYILDKPQHGLANLIYDNYIKDTPDDKRSIWCLSNKNKQYLVRSSDEWKEDKNKGYEFATPKIEEIKPKIIDKIHDRIWDINIKMDELEENEEENLEELYDLKTKRKKLMKFCTYLDDKSKNFGKDILYKLDLTFDWNNHNINNIEDKLSNYLKMK